MGYTLELKRLEDLLDHTDYVNEVYYKCDETEEGVYYFKIKAGKVYWEGFVRKKDKVYERLMHVLKIKGVEIKDAHKDDEFAEVLMR